MGLLLVATVTAPAMATVYDYTGNMDNGSWVLEKVEAYYWDLWYGPGMAQTANYQQFQAVYQDPDTSGNRGAFTWQVPAGEVITAVTFNWNGSSVNEYCVVRGRQHERFNDGKLQRS